MTLFNGTLRAFSLAILSAVMLALGIALLQWALDVGPWRELMPHYVCWQERTGLIWTTAVADCAIWVAYWSFPLQIAWLTRFGHLPFPGLMWMIGTFVMACGATHAMDLWTIWTPTYYAAAVVKMLTAIVSLTCVGVTAVGIGSLGRQRPETAARLRRLAERVREVDPDAAAILDQLARSFHA